MRSASGTGSSRGTLRWLALLAATGLLAAVLGACGSMGGKGNGTEKTVLLTRKGESSIQVTESELNGDQIVRINTNFQGEQNSIVLDIDQPVYEVEIPLTLEQVLPPGAASAARGPEGQFQDLLVAQYLQKVQEAMLAGDYNGALRQVDTVLQVQPNNVPAHTMKGSIYYALGNYELANQEWEQVLALDPSNKEVLDFQEFLRNRSSGQAPKLPGAPTGTQAPGAGNAAPPPPAPGGGGSSQ